MKNNTFKIEQEVMFFACITNRLEIAEMIFNEYQKKKEHKRLVRSKEVGLTLRITNVTLVRYAELGEYVVKVDGSIVI